MASPFVHLELTTGDVPAAKKFYGEMFGWEFNDMPMGEGAVYSTFKTDGGPGGGLVTMPGAPTAWLGYIGVEDIKAATAKAVSLGAKVLHEAEVPDMGWLALMTDPTGAAVAMWQSKTA